MNIGKKIKMKNPFIKRKEDTSRISAEKGKLAWEFDSEFQNLMAGDGSTDFKRLSNTNRKSSMYMCYLTTKYLIANKIPGHFVECGVFWGRQVMVMGLTLNSLGISDREIWLYDTFSGMTEPGQFDRYSLVDKGDDWVKKNWQDKQQQDHNEWCYSALEEVTNNVFRTGYPQERFRFIEGDVRKTIPNNNHEEIALLRLDTDFYESTKHELEHLFPLVAKGGIISIDDYGAFSGARKAVDEYFEAMGVSPLLFPVNGTERCFIKV